jgi:hypothetical protein
MHRKMQATFHFPRWQVLRIKANFLTFSRGLSALLRGLTFNRMRKKVRQRRSRIVQQLTVRPRDKSQSWQARGGRVRMNDSPLGHWALTGSRPSADVTLIFFASRTSLRPCLGQGASLTRRGRAGKKVAFLRILRAILIPACQRELIAAYCAEIEFRSLLRPVAGPSDVASCHRPILAGKHGR